MLKEIRIQNLAIVAESFVDFDCGFNVLTGETGAGKSILVDSIGFLAGKRASSNDVRQGASSAFIEGLLEFDPKHFAKVKAFLESAGIPSEDDQVILRRVIYANGKSRAFVNHCSWTMSGLSELARFWLDVTGQHGQHDLLNSKKHLHVLDDFGDCESENENYGRAFQAVKKLDNDFEAAKSELDQIRKDQAYYEFQLKEFSQLDVEPDEIKEIEDAIARTGHAEQLLSSVQTIQEWSDGEQGLSQVAASITQEWAKMKKLDASVETWGDEIEQINECVNSLSMKVSSYESNVQFDPAELESMNERLARVQSFSRKYGSLEASLNEKQRIEGALQKLEDFTMIEREYEQNRAQGLLELKNWAKTLGEKRRKKAKLLEKKITGELGGLGMAQAEIKIDVTPVSEAEAVICNGKEHYSRQGTENIRFLFSPNPGEGLRPLDQIASGGELSRILLAIKSVGMLSLKYQNKTFLFDEVDTGIGGETAERVGQRMSALASDGRQVLCVTHLAQVASYADHHLKVEKQAEKGRTQTRVSLLSSEERKLEVARMMGGIDISEKALDHALELLERGNDFRL